MIQIAYGGGVNSVAMLLGLFDRKITPDFILFSDTGGEKPHTYKHIEYMNVWCKENGFPPIETIKANGKTLEEDCLDRNALPSIAYGFKTCSQRWKIDVQKSYMKKKKIEYTSYIGFDLDESHRIKNYEGTYYPLVEWGMGREDCVELIKKHNIPIPMKSACFFCPSTKANEVMLLQRMYPDLTNRALKMEKNADLNSIKGLGRSWAWKDVLKQNELFEISDDELNKLFPIYQEMPCGCIDS